MKKSKHILFVDDDLYEMLGLVERLEAAGYKVTSETSPNLAQLLLRKGFQPDLIISDLIMPATFEPSPMSNRHVGVDFCRQVRAMGLTMPILVLTVVTDPVVLNEARKYATALLVKPVIPKDLLRRVEAVLSDAGAEEPGA